MAEDDEECCCWLAEWSVATEEAVSSRAEKP